MLEMIRMLLHMIRPGDQETRMSEKVKKKKPVTNHFSQKEPYKKSQVKKSEYT